jgi:hypothetical protein
MRQLVNGQLAKTGSISRGRPPTGFAIVVAGAKEILDYDGPFHQVRHWDQELLGRLPWLQSLPSGASTVCSITKSGVCASPTAS